MNKNLLVAYGVWLATVVVILFVVMTGNVGLLQTNLHFLFSSLNLNLPILTTILGISMVLPALALFGLFILTFYYYVPSLYRFPFFLGGNKEKGAAAQVLVKKVIVITMIVNTLIYLATVLLFSVFDVATLGQNSLLILFVVVFGPIILIDFYYEVKAFLTQAEAIKTK